MSDLLRVIILGQGSIVLVLTFVIMRRYGEIRKRRHYTNIFMPLHLILIGVSYVLATFFMIMQIVDRFNNEFSWRIPVAFISFLVGDLGLWLTSEKLYKDLNREL
jgi:hydrogenase-4 membrane subunit HyfE